MSSKLPVPSYRRDVRKFATPSKGGEKQSITPVATPSPAPVVAKNKYSHVQSRVKTFWTPQDLQKPGVKQFFERKGTVSASTSASSSATHSPSHSANQTMIATGRKFFPQLSGSDFAARLNELKMSIQANSKIAEISSSSVANNNDN